MFSRLLLIPSLVFGLLAGFIAPSFAADHAVILMYHRFGEDQYPSTNVRLEQFEEHLEVLAQGQYNVLPLDDIVAHLQSGEPLPDRTVAITIDDAYLSVYEQAFPRLQRYGFTATIFVATQPVDRGLRGYMSWEQLRELQAAGFGIGSQTRSHPHMHRLSVAENRDELAVSNDRFLTELGMRPNLFAYPYGEYSIDVINEVRGLPLIVPDDPNSPECVMHSSAQLNVELDVEGPLRYEWDTQNSYMYRWYITSGHSAVEPVSLGGEGIGRYQLLQNSYRAELIFTVRDPAGGFSVGRQALNLVPGIPTR